jgi:hypothetical protein
MERVGQLLQTAIAVKAHVSWVVGNASHVSRYRLAKAVAKHDLALVVGAPERVRRGWPRERGASGGVASAAPPSDQTMTVQHGVHGADRWELRAADCRRSYNVAVDPFQAQLGVRSSPERNIAIISGFCGGGL